MNVRTKEERRQWPIVTDEFFYFVYMFFFNVKNKIHIPCQQQQVTAFFTQKKKILKMFMRLVFVSFAVSDIDFLASKNSEKTNE